MDPIEAFLNRLQHPVLAGIELKLERMQRLLSLLGNPQKRFPPVVHVAGTNGKGSLLAYLQSIFQAAGYRVHRYTSPHLVHFRERIMLQGREIDNAYLETILKHVASVLPSQPATFFEAATAIAFLAFAEKPADILLLETGMGGRLDATNVVDKPLVTAITPVSFDHCSYLGNTIAAIAGEKAGIIKQAVPCVVGKQELEADEVIAAKAQTLSAPLSRYGQEWEVEWQGDTAYYVSTKRKIELHPALAGRHQYDNAATAIACIEQMPQFTITDAHIAQGLAQTVWPARLQRLEKGHFTQLLPEGMELWLDGGHNQQGGEILGEWLKDRANPEAYLICGMVQGKDTEAFLKPLVPYAKTLYAVTIPDESTSQTAQQVQKGAADLGMRALIAPSIENALQTIAHHAKTPAIICICGSLYLAGKVLATQSK